MKRDLRNLEFSNLEFLSSPKNVRIFDAFEFSSAQRVRRVTHKTGASYPYRPCSLLLPGLLVSLLRLLVFVGPSTTGPRFRVGSPLSGSAAGLTL